MLRNTTPALPSQRAQQNVERILVSKQPHCIIERKQNNVVFDRSVRRNFTQAVERDQHIEKGPAILELQTQTTCQNFELTLYDCTATSDSIVCSMGIRTWCKDNMFEGDCSVQTHSTPCSADHSMSHVCHCGSHERFRFFTAIHQTSSQLDTSFDTRTCLCVRLCVNVSARTSTGTCPSPQTVTLTFGVLALSSVVVLGWATHSLTKNPRRRSPLHKELREVVWIHLQRVPTGLDSNPVRGFTTKVGLARNKTNMQHEGLQTSLETLWKETHLELQRLPQKDRRWDGEQAAATQGGGEEKREKDKERKEDKNKPDHTIYEKKKTSK